MHFLQTLAQFAVPFFQLMLTVLCGFQVGFEPQTLAFREVLGDTRGCRENGWVNREVNRVIRWLSREWGDESGLIGWVEGWVNRVLG